jgi:membrane associated rhomboid family serine protease
MHCQSYALETGKYLLRLEKNIFTHYIQFVLVIYILRTGYLHIMYSLYWLYIFYVQVIYTLCTVLLLLFTFYVCVVFTFIYGLVSYSTALQC